MALGTNVGSAFIDIEPKLVKGFGSDVERQVGSQMAGVGQSMEKSLAPSLLKIGAAIGAAFSVRAVVDFAQASIKAMSDLNESTSKAMVVFGDSFADVEEFAAGAADSVLLSSQAALEAAGTFGNLFTAMGLSQQEAAALSPTVVQLGADLASFNNLGVEETLEKLRSGLVGEVEPLRALGVSLNAAMVEAKAFELGLVDANGVVTEAGKVQARWQLILEATTNAQGDVARTADGVANVQRNLTAEFENLQAEIGEKLLPVFATLLEQGGSILDFFRSLIPELDGTTEAVEGVASGMSAVTSAAVLTGGNIGDVFGGIGDAAQGLLGIVQGVDDILTDQDFGFSELNAQMDQFNERIASGFIRAASQQISNDMAKGTEAVDAFASAIAFLGRQDDSFRTIEESFTRLATVAGLSDDELMAATKTLLDMAPALGLNASEVAFLEGKVALLNTQLIVATTRIPRAGQAIADELSPAIETVVELDLAGFFSEADVMAEELGVSVGELVFGTDQLGASLLATLDPGEQLAARLNIIADDADIAADVLETGLVGSIESVKDAFVDANEDMEVSAEEFFAALLESQAVEVAFHENLLRIATIAPALASKLKAEGAEAAAHVAAGYAGDLDLAAQTELVILQQTPEIGALIERLTMDAVKLANTDPAALELWLAYAASLQIPGLIASVTAALNNTLTGAIGAVNAGALGAGLGAGLVSGMTGYLTSSAATSGISAAATSMINKGLEMASPSKLMMSLGALAGEGFVIGMRDEIEAAELGALPAQTLAASRSVSASSEAIEGVSGGGGALSTAAPQTSLPILLDGKVLAEVVINWQSRLVRQVVRAGG